MRKILGFLFAFVVGAGGAHAASILVADFSFESAVIASGNANAVLLTAQAVNNTVATGGWRRSGTEGARFLDPGANNYDAPFNTDASAAPHGENVLWHAGGSNRLVWQTLGSNLAEGTYNLQVMVGNRLNEIFNTGSIELWAGGTRLARTVLDDVAVGTSVTVPNTATCPAGVGNCTSPVNVNINDDGAWVDVGFLYAASAVDPNLGSALQIRFYVNNNEMTFDNVRLDYTAAIPEPEIYAMMMAGLGLMGFIARRRKQQLAAG